MADNEGYFNFIFSADTTGFNKAIDESIAKVNKAEKDAQKQRSTTAEGAIKQKLSKQLKDLMQEEAKGKGKIVDAEKRLNRMLERRKRIEQMLERKDITKQRRAAVHLANARNEARIMGIQARLAEKKAKAQRQGGGIGGRLRGAGSALAQGGMQALGGIPGLGGAAGMLGAGAAGFGAAAAGLAGAAIVGGAGAGTMAEIGAATDRRARAADIGVDVESLHMLELAAERTGTNFQAVDQSVGQFRMALEEAGKGDQFYSGLIEQAGLDVQKAIQMGTVPAFMELMDKLKNSSDSQEAFYKASELLGSSASQILPAAMRGFKEAGEAALEMGAVLSNEMQADLVEASDAWKELTMELKVLFAPLAVTIAKAFKDAIKFVLNFGYELEAAAVMLSEWKFGLGTSREEAADLAVGLLNERKEALERRLDLIGQAGAGGQAAGGGIGFIAKDFTPKGMAAAQAFPAADAMARIGLFVGQNIPKEQLAELKNMRELMSTQQAALESIDKKV
jgi:hypothetical protein